MKISTKQYSQTLFDLTAGKTEQEVLIVVKNFAAKLKADGQLRNAGRIMEKYTELYNASHGIVTTHIVGRQELLPDMIEKIKEFVRKKYNAKEVEMNFVVDEKIQGGIIIQVGDEIMDGSVSAQLKKLQKVLEK